MADGSTRDVFCEITLDFEERSLIVHYETERVQGGAHSIEPRKKRIRMKPLAPGADMAGLAGAIIKGCAGLVPGNQLPVLIELLHELQHHDSASAGGAVEPRAAPSAAPVPAAAAAGRNPDGAAMGRAAPAVAAAGPRGSFTGSAAPPTRPVAASRRTASDSGYGGHASTTDGKDGSGEDHRYGHQSAGHRADGAAGARPPSPRAAASLGAPSGGSGGGAAAAALLEAEAADEDSGDEGSRIARVDDYAEALYEEDMAAKMAGARMLLALAKQPRNLRELCDNGTLLGMLGRVLREDWRKNVDLTVLLMQFFFCLSHFSQLHGTLSELRIGDLAMRMVELEHRRYTARRLDHERLHRLAELQAAGDREGEAAFRAADAEARKAEEAAAEAAAASAAARASAATSKAERNARRTASLEGGGEGEDGYDDDADGDGAGGGGSSARSGGGAGGGAAAEAAEVLKRIKLKPLPPGAVDVDKEWRKGRVLNRKQEGLLFVCLSLLMNLAEDVAIERKMCKRNVVGLLVPLLERDNPALLLLAVAFLRKLSIFEENKDAMAALDVAPKLAALLPEPHTLAGAAAASVSPVVTQLQVSVLHLIFNLTFDREMCGQFVAGGVLAKLPAMLKVPAFRSTGIKALYHLTQDLAVRGAMAATDAPALVLKLVTAFPQATLPLELAALGINLAMDHATAERVLLAAGEAGVKALVSRAVKSGDVLLLKMLRGLAQHTYAAQADECLKAAAAEEEAWRRAAEEEAAERAARSSRRGASVGAGAASDSKRGGGVDGKEDEAPEEEEPEEEEEAPLQIPPMPDEAIEYDYSAAGLWAGGVRDLLRFAVKSEDKPEVLVETLGLLASLTALDLPESLTPAGVLEDASFLAFLERRLSLGAAAGADDDVLLEAVQLLASLALDADAAGVIAASRLPSLLGDLLAEKVADTDMLLQIVCAVLRLLHHEPSRDAIVGRTRIPQRVVELLGHACDQLAADADECVYIMIEHDRASSGSTGLWQQLQSRRFQLHNREWVAAAGSGADDEDDHAAGTYDYSGSGGKAAAFAGAGGRFGAAGGAGAVPYAGAGGGARGSGAGSSSGAVRDHRHPSTRLAEEHEEEGEEEGGPHSPGCSDGGSPMFLRSRNELVAMDLSSLVASAAMAGSAIAAQRPRSGAVAPAGAGTGAAGGGSGPRGSNYRTVSGWETE